MKKKLLIVITVLIVEIFFITGCGNSVQTGAEKDLEEMKTLTLGSTGYFCNEGWDPTFGWDAMYIQSYGVAETLFRLNDDYVANPWLVKSYKQTDDNTWEFILKDSVNFHNGDKMTAESVKKCFERSLELNERAKTAIPLDSIKAEGQVLTIKTSSVAPTLINDLADPIWVVYNTENTENFSETTYYTGPFKPVSFEANIELVVEKNKDYWGEEAKVDQAILKTFKDDDALIMALQSEEIDIVVPLSASNYVIIKDDSKFTVDSAVSTRAQFLQLNLERPILKDKAVRKALAMCIDRKGYADSICYGRDKVTYGIYPDVLSFGGTEGLDPEVSKMEPEGAEKILKEAGYTDSNGNGILDKDGVELSMSIVTFSNYTSQIQLYEVLQNQLKNIGIDLQIKALETPNDYVRSGDFDIKGGSYILAPTGTPQYFINLMFTSEGSNNYGHYSNVEVDNLVAKLSKTFDEKEQIKITREIQKKVLNDFAFIFFAHESFTGAYNKETVKIYHSHPSELYILDSNVEMQ